MWCAVELHCIILRGVCNIFIFPSLKQCEGRLNVDVEEEEVREV